MASLKAFLPTLGDIFQMSHHGLYNRQRALVDLGVIQYVRGRGPGSGSPLTADGVAALLVSLLCANDLNGVGSSVVSTCNARRSDTHLVPTTFQDEVALCLSGIFRLPDEISVRRGQYAEIRRGAAVPRFTITESADPLPIIYTSHMRGCVLGKVGDALRKAVS